MTFNPNADVSNNRARRGRGSTIAVAGGGTVGLGVIAILLFNLFTGSNVDPNLLGGGGSSNQSQETQTGTLENCATGADANASDDCRIGAASLAIDQFWGEQLQGYREPTLTVVDGSLSTPCGTASNAVGPFYCPSDEGVYIDPTFFQLMRDQFGATANELAQLYVVAHEYGHHVQNIVGTMAQHPQDGPGAASNGVRMELQADCYAGAWVGAMTEQEDANGVAYLQTPTAAEITDALNAAATVGDDNIQRQSGGQVNPESWTHGSSAQRERWFQQGMSGGVGTCDTFAVEASAL